MRKTRFLILLIILFAAGLAFAEEIKLTTIVPDQTVLRAKKGAIGETYSDPATMPNIDIPTSSLLVEGNVGIRSTGSSVGNGQEFRLHNPNADTANRRMLALKLENVVGGTKLYFRARNDDSSQRADIMTLDLTNDNVGIGNGTVLPSPLLYLNGTADTAPTTPGLLVLGLTNGTNISMDGNEIMARNNGVVYPLYLNNEGGNIILNGTNAAGNVGIGTSNPTAKLYVNGNLNVNGSISKLAGSFDIKHPDPDKTDWRLRHSFVESPTRGDNVYRYLVRIKNDGGETAIMLPSFWKHLNENPQVWVSAVDQFAHGYGYVDSSLEKLFVKGEKEGNYNVLLIGTRKDVDAKNWFDTLGVEYQVKNPE